MFLVDCSLEDIINNKKLTSQKAKKNFDRICDDYDIDDYDMEEILCRMFPTVQGDEDLGVNWTAAERCLDFNPERIERAILNDLNNFNNLFERSIKRIRIK